MNERVRQARGHAGLTRSEIAAQLGVSQQAVQQWEREQKPTHPRRDKVQRLAELTGVREAWLMSGDGEMLSGRRAGDLPGAQDAARPHGSAEQTSPSELGNYTLVPRYNITAGMGPGEWFRSEQIIDELAFKTSWLRSQGLQPDRVAAIACRGDSMSPTIRDGDVALIDLRARDLKQDGIYAIRRASNGDDDEIIVKRIQVTLAGTLRVLSDNIEAVQSEEYPTGTAPEIAVVGRVVWAGGAVR